MLILILTTSALTINGSGGLVAYGGSGGAAGIGGNSYNYKGRSDGCGTVTINSGMVTAQGGAHSSAGIGGGYKGSGGTIIINGGTVNALEYNDGGEGIGNGSDNSNGGTLTMNGNAVVFATSVSDTSPKTKGILFIRDYNYPSSVNYLGMMYGDVILEQNASINSGSTLAIGSGTLTVCEGIALTNNSIIATNGGTVVSGGVFGTLPGIGNVAQTVTITDIPGITIPSAGAIPVTTIEETGQYTGTVQWSPNHSVF